MSGVTGILIGLFLGFLVLMVVLSQKLGKNKYRRSNNPDQSSHFSRMFENNETQKIFQKGDPELASLLQALATGSTITLNNKTFTISENASFKVEYEQERGGQELEIKVRW